MLRAWLAPPLLWITHGHLAGVEIHPQLSIDGYLDAVFEASQIDDAELAQRASTDDDVIDSGGSTILDSDGVFQLEPQWRVGDDITGAAQLRYAFESDSWSVPETWVTWRVLPWVAVTVGRFDNGIGWETDDAPDRDRVNPSVLHNSGLWGTDLSGARIHVTPDPDGAFSYRAWIADTVFDGAYGTVATDEKLAYGAELVYIEHDIGLTTDLDLAVELDATSDVNGELSNAFAFALDLSWAGLPGPNDQPRLRTAFGLSYVDFNRAAAYGLYTSTTVQFERAAITLMTDYVEPNDDDRQGGRDDEALEVAVAVLTQPSAASGFSFNGELRYIHRSADEANEIGCFLQALAIIP